MTIQRSKFSGLLSCRIARIACTPVVGMVSQQLWSFNSESQGYLQDAAGLEVLACSSVQHIQIPHVLLNRLKNRASQKKHVSVLLPSDF